MEQPQNKTDFLGCDTIQIFLFSFSIDLLTIDKSKYTLFIFFEFLIHIF